MDPLHGILEEWYAAHARDLPWRATRDAYLIWLSETILQQTRVGQGLDYYLRFASRFPDVSALAAASEDEVLKMWQGLGYYSRARNLRAAARQIVERFGGRFPRSYADVRGLRGVGDYTAAAVCSFAYGDPYPVIDGNVQRVFARLFDLEEPVDGGPGRKSLAELAARIMDGERPALWNQAVMEFGALHCTPARPACAECPLADRCAALAKGTVSQRPVKRNRTQVRTRWFNYLHLTGAGRTLIRRREGNDIWRGLYEFPMIESDAPMPYEELAATDAFRTLTCGQPYRLAATVVLPEHRLTHRIVRATVYRLEGDRAPRTVAPGCRSIAEEELGDYAVSRLTERYLLG